MGKHFKLAILSVACICMGFNHIDAKAMTLTYNGKQFEYNQPPIKLNVNGANIETTVMPPVMINDRVLVPVREVFEPLGASIEWKNNEKALYLSYQETVMIMKANDPNVWVNGKTIVTDVPTMLINDKIMVPVRFISENMNCEVKWVGGDERTVYVNEIVSEPEPEEPQKPEEPQVPEEPQKPEEPQEPEKPQEPEQPQKPEQGLEDIFSGIQEYYENSVNNLVVYKDKQNLSTSRIDSVHMSGSSKEATALIQANGGISDMNVALENGKLIIDILNSKSNLASSITPSSNTYVKSIRTSQYETTTTRVVFDLQSGAKVNVDLSQDRQSILIQFSPQSLQGVAVGKDQKGDYIVIENMTADQMQIDPYGEDGLLHIQIPNTRLDNPFTWDRIKGEQIQEVYGMENKNSTELVVVFDGEANYIHRVENVNGHTVIRFSNPTFKNVQYKGNTENTLVISKEQGLKLRDIKVTDLYRQRKITIDLGADYASYYGHGTINIDDQVLKDITVQTNGTTQFVVNEKTIHAVNLKEDENNIYIEFVKPKEKYKKIVVLDIGHGGTDAGAIGTVKEKELNYKQAMAIKAKLEKQGDIKVYMTREDDTTLTLAYRTELANEIDTDIFVSVHNNSVSNPNTSGTEVLYFPSSTDTRSMEMARITQKHLIAAVGTVNRGIKPRPDLYVLRTSNMPAILLEGGFVTNQAEATKLNSQEFVDKYAQGAADAIVEIFNTLSFR